MKKFEYLRGLSYSERLYLFDKWIDQQFEELRNDPSAIRYTIFLDQGNDYYEFRNQAAALPNGFIKIEKFVYDRMVGYGFENCSMYMINQSTGEQLPKMKIQINDDDEFTLWHPDFSSIVRSV